MNQTEQPTPDHPHVDHEHDTAGKPFDTATGYSGQGYSIERERELGRSDPSGGPARGARGRGEPATDADGEDVPGEVGRRASFDPATGQAHGSGSGAGPEGEGEDFDTGTSGA